MQRTTPTLVILAALTGCTVVRFARVGSPSAAKPPGCPIRFEAMTPQEAFAHGEREVGSGCVAHMAGAQDWADFQESEKDQVRQAACGLGGDMVVVTGTCTEGGGPDGSPMPGLAVMVLTSATESGEPQRLRFDDAEHWAKVFDSPERDAWQRPDQVIAALNLAPTATVADLGAGTGYFSVRLARALPQGHVFAADIEPKLLTYLRERATREHLENLTAVHAWAESSGLREPVDLVLVVDTYHHVQDRVAYFHRLAEQLRPRGRLVIIDFKKGVPMGPPDSEKVAPEDVVKELAAAGYRIQSELTLLPNQYFLIFERE